MTYVTQTDDITEPKPLQTLPPKKVKLAWVEFQSDFDAVADEYKGLKERLVDEEFLKTVEDSVKKAGIGTGSGKLREALRVSLSGARTQSLKEMD